MASVYCVWLIATRRSDLSIVAEVMLVSRPTLPEAKAVFQAADKALGRGVSHASRDVSEVMNVVTMLWPDARFEVRLVVGMGKP